MVANGTLPKDLLTSKYQRIGRSLQDSTQLTGETSYVVLNYDTTSGYIYYLVVDNPCCGQDLIEFEYNVDTGI